MTYNEGMKNDTIQVRIDPEIKKEAELIINDMGFTLSSAIQLFLAQVVQKREIPFKITAHNPNWRTRTAIKDAERMMKHPDRYPTYSRHEDLVKEIEEELSIKK